jgi:hypothetical protein
MSTKALRLTVPTRFASKADGAAVRRGERASAARRLASLKAAEMPWLSERGLAALADAPELSGPAAYKKLPSQR